MPSNDRLLPTSSRGWACRVVLASLVTRKDTGMPGEGYFRHAASIGRDVRDRRAFWQAEAARVYAAYRHGRDG